MGWKTNLESPSLTRARKPKPENSEPVPALFRTATFKNPKIKGLPKIRIISTDQEDEGRVSDERDGGRQLPLDPARVGSGAAVRVRGQAQALQAPLGVLETNCGSAN